MLVAARGISGLSPLCYGKDTVCLPLGAVITAHRAPFCMTSVSALTLNSGVEKGTLQPLEILDETSN